MLNAFCIWTLWLLIKEQGKVGEGRERREKMSTKFGDMVWSLSSGCSQEWSWRSWERDSARWEVLRVKKEWKEEKEDERVWERCARVEEGVSKERVGLGRKGWSLEKKRRWEREEKKSLKEKREEESGGQEIRVSKKEMRHFV